MGSCVSLLSGKAGRKGVAFVCYYYHELVAYICMSAATLQFMLQSGSNANLYTIVLSSLFCAVLVITILLLLLLLVVCFGDDSAMIVKSEYI